MMRSLYSGVSGLTVHQTQMDVIGNNIANINTIGYKSSSAQFSDVFSQTVQSATGVTDNSGGTNAVQIGLGVSLASISLDMTDGAAQTTYNTLDLQIDGDGFFVVSDATGNYFTRAGAFSIDEAGNLVNSDGMYVMGWYPDETGTSIEQTDVQKLQILEADNLYIEPSYTEDITMSGNIDATDDDIISGDYTFSVTLYDSLGYPYTADFTLSDTGTDNQYLLSLPASSITDSDSATITNDAVSAVITFDPSTGQVTSSVPTDVSIDNISTDFSEFADISIDISSLTMFSGSTTVGAVAGDSDGLGAGNEYGTMTGYDIGTDGQILGTYTNGETKLLGQIVVASFTNPSGLEKVGGSLFAETSNSGEFDGIGVDITSSGGSLNSGALEMSNVDLASEFTEMIITQRGYQACSKVITTSDELLQELVNLK
jgi:flagellar hook protein FlgE